MKPEMFGLTERLLSLETDDSDDCFGSNSDKPAGSAEPSAGAGGGEYRHIAGGGGGVCEAGDVVFDRQGLVGDAAAGAEGVRFGEDSGSATACGYELQVSRDDHVSR